MYLYFDKQGTLKTAIPHGQPVRQGSDLHLVVCLDPDFFSDPVTKDNWQLQLFLTLPNGENRLGTGILPDVVPTSTTIFTKTVDSEITYDLIDGNSYWMYEWHLTASQSTVYNGNLTANIRFLKQEYHSQGNATIAFSSTACVGPNGTAVRTITVTDGANIDETDILVYTENNIQSIAKVFSVSNDLSTKEYKIIFSTQAKAFMSQTEPLNVEINRLSVEVEQFVGRSSIYVETTLGWATTQVDESSLHYENLLKQISYLSTIFQNGSSIYPYNKDLTFEFVDSETSIVLNDILVPIGKKLLLNDLIVDRTGQIGRVYTINPDTKEVVLRFFADIGGSQFFLYEKQGTSVYVGIPYQLPAIPVKDLQNLTGTRTVKKGDIVIVKYATPNNFGQSLFLGYITTVADVPNIGRLCTIQVVYPLSGKDGPKLYTITSNDIKINGQVQTTAPEQAVDNAVLGFNAKYKQGDNIIVTFANPNSFDQKNILYIIKNEVTLGLEILLKPIAFVDGKQGVRGNGIKVFDGVPIISEDDLIGDLALNKITYDLYKVVLSNEGLKVYNFIGNIKGATGESGKDGKDGRGIKTITKTSTAGLVDTYTITYSDNTTSTFTVTNGKDGKSIDSIISVDVTPATVSVDNNGIHLNGSVKATDDKGEETVTAISQDIPIVGSEHISVDKDAATEKVVVKFDQTVLDEIDTHEQEISEIQAKISPQASSTNQLADKNFVNSSINNIAAFYITKDANGTAFTTYAELAATTTFYSGGEVRVPSRNDYCIVREDETHLINGKPSTTRYIYQNNWEFQYIVNETALTAEQLAAINSGITAALVGQIGTNKNEIAGIKTNYAQKTGTYSGMTVGKATSADKATQDGDGKNIASTYAKQTGTYPNITAGKATNADVATKAKQDNDGNDISTTYAKNTDVVLKAVQGSKTTEMTEEVGIDANGKLWVKVGGSGGFEEDAEIYNITTTVTNGSSSGASTILENGTATVTLTASTGYELPDTITVSGATYLYIKSTGVVTLSNPTGNVTISATCVSMAGFSITLEGITGNQEYALGELEGHINTIDGTSFTGYLGSGSGQTVTFEPNTFTDVKKLVFDTYAMHAIISVTGSCVGNKTTDDDGNDVYEIISDGTVLITTTYLD